MTNLILTIGTCAWLALLFIGFGYMVYTCIRDDIRREKARKESLRKTKYN